MQTNFAVRARVSGTTAGDSEKVQAPHVWSWEWSQAVKCLGLCAVESQSAADAPISLRILTQIQNERQNVRTGLIWILVFEPCYISKPPL